MAKKKKLVRCGIIGYGGAFNMGKHHGESMHKTGKMKVTAACDIDAKRMKVAEEDFPGIQTFTDVDQFIQESETDLVTIITPHNTHAPLAMKCLAAGKHVITEKPFTITTKEATDIIELAKKKKLMASVFHNRRWDGDFQALMEITQSGLIGEVFHVEACMSGYNRPSDKWWRSFKETSGGAFYDWGAHVVDWVLHIAPYKIKSVSGYFQVDPVWKNVTNEDHVEATVRFKNGASANIEMSSIAAVGKSRWRILGTKGAITDGEGQNFKVVTFIKGKKAEIQWPHKEYAWHDYYQDVANHLVNGKKLGVTAESARRVIMVLDYAEQSFKKGMELETPFD